MAAAVTDCGVWVCVIIQSFLAALSASSFSASLDRLSSRMNLADEDGAASFEGCDITREGMGIAPDNKQREDDCHAEVDSQVENDLLVLDVIEHEAEDTNQQQQRNLERLEDARTDTRLEHLVQPCRQNRYLLDLFCRISCLRQTDTRCVSMCDSVRAGQRGRSSSRSFSPERARTNLRIGHLFR